MITQWKAGDNYKPDNTDCWISGIHIQKIGGSGKIVESHGNAIECYGLTEVEAVERRDLILAAMTQITVVKVVRESWHISLRMA